MKGDLKPQRKTARVFFSSPFGGLEEEREELTKKYWPQLSSICKKNGYEFVPVDMRWGITSEMSSNAATIEICLREMDRSDMIVGFFGQRYGWHGFDALLQKSFDVAAVKYPWLNEYRDRAVTELEFLHGHLRDPGKRAACFFFRDKSYDDAKLKLAEEAGDERQARRFRSSTDGPKAAEHLADLKVRVQETKDKCLAVHMNYKNPKEGAKLMYETIEKYLREVFLARPMQTLSALEEERVLHDVFMVSRLAMGGVYVGGADYMSMIDIHVKSQTDKENPKHLVITGDAGAGKTCLLGNWSLHHKEKFPSDAVVCHFAGCTSGSTAPKKILRRLLDELNNFLKEKTSVEKETVEVQEIRDLVREMTDRLKKITEAGYRTIIVIDALNKVDESGQTTKVLPPNAHLIVSLTRSDVIKATELTEERAYAVIEVSPLKEPEREEIALATLEVRGKALSSEQKSKIVTKAQTENPLFLKTLLEELCSFGEFFQLDAFLDRLLQACDTKELFLKFLERLEQDYNPKEYNGNLIKDIMCCILVSRQGLSETEIKAILKISDQMWSVVYFAIEDFLLERSGLLGFSYDELTTAIEEKYCQEQATVKHYIVLEVEYFEARLKEKSLEYTTILPERVIMELPWLLEKAGEKDRLIKCLTIPSLFWALRISSGDIKYDLLHYWKSTSLTGDEINAWYEKAVDDQLALLYLKEQENGRQLINAVKMLHPLVYEISQFQMDAGNVTAVQPFLNRAIKLLKSAHPDDEINSNIHVAKEFCTMSNSLACLYVNTEEFDKAEPLHKEVLELRQKFADKWDDGWSSVASCYNDLGVLCYRTNKFDEALAYYKKCLELHRRSLLPTHHLIPDTLNNIGAVYHSMGKWKECVNTLEEALQLYEDAYFGQLPPDVGGTLLNLAMAYRRQDDTNTSVHKAESLYLRALDIRTKAYGPDHKDVGQTLLSYSAFLFVVDPKKSADVAKQAVEIFEKSFGPEHTNTLNALENVALGLARNGQFDEAHPYFKKAGVIRHRKGQMSSSIKFLNAAMADYYLNNGHHEEARQLFERLVWANFASDRDFAALDFLDHDLLGENRPTRPYKETVDYGLEKFPSSEMLFDRKLSKLAEIGDSEGILKILEKGSFEARKYNESYQSFVELQHRKEGLEIITIANGKFPEDTVILHNLAMCHTFYKDYEKASSYFQKLLHLQPEDALMRTNYGRILALSGQAQKAMEQLTEALRIAEDKNEEQLIEQTTSYLRLLQETSKPERQ
ncbi:TPR repeat-containing protein DDB_G0287407-like isoform X2 [Montipora foliosa]|uniref:TPR repeat-containing protein DDB_G0287407-like isoform X2 n=1 Tax=Montipora foliosa TaxID=591990 RepID=UPI0035F14314